MCEVGALVGASSPWLEKGDTNFVSKKFIVVSYMVVWQFICKVLLFYNIIELIQSNLYVHFHKDYMLFICYLIKWPWIV